MTSEIPNVESPPAAQNPSKSSTFVYSSIGEVGLKNVVAAYSANPDQDGDEERLLAQEAQVEASWRTGSTHLSRSPSGLWYMRLKVPESIRQAYPHLPKELRRSTKTRHRLHALAISRKMCLDFFIRYKNTETSMAQPDRQEHIALQRDSFVVTYVDGQLSISTKDISLSTLSKLTQIVQGLQTSFAANDAAFVASVQAAPVAYVPEAHPQMRAQAAVPLSKQPVHALAQTTHQDVMPTSSMPSTIQTGAMARNFETSSSTPEWLSDAIEYWRANGPNRFSDESWQHSYKPTFRILREVIGTERRSIQHSDGSVEHGAPDIRICDLTSEHLVRFHEALKVLPPNQGHNTALVEALHRIRDREKNKQPLPSAHSVEKKLGHVQPFIKYAKQSKWLHPDVLDAMELSRKSAAALLVKTDRKKVRKPGFAALNTDELRKLFGHAAFTANAEKKPWSYWIPLFCLYQGMRVSEASQLYTDDIITLDGVPCVSLIEDAQADVEEQDLMEVARSSEEYRRLKNTSSRRNVPLHPKLIELGFLSFYEKVKKANPIRPVHLYPQLKWDTKQMFGRKPSRTIIEWMKNVGVHQTRYKVAHSLRSNFNQALTATLLPADLISILMGHATGSMKDSNYNMTDHGPALPFSVIVEHMKRMEFGLDLMPLAGEWS